MPRRSLIDIQEEFLVKQREFQAAKEELQQALAVHNAKQTLKRLFAAYLLAAKLTSEELPSNEDDTEDSGGGGGEPNALILIDRAIADAASPALVALGPDQLRSDLAKVLTIFEALVKPSERNESDIHLIERIHQLVLRRKEDKSEAATD